MAQNDEARRLQNKQIDAILMAAFPNVFKGMGKPTKPFKLGIHIDVYDRLKPMMPGISRRNLAGVLAGYARSDKYLHGVREGVARVDVDGNPAGVVTAGEASRARALQAQRKEKGKANGV